jgi:hypothetical protein
LRFDCEEEFLVAVDDGGCDCGGDEADNDEERATDAGFGFREVVGFEDLGL